MEPEICRLTWQGGLCRCDEVEDFEMERLSWIVRVAQIWVLMRKRQEGEPEKEAW